MAVVVSGYYPNYSASGSDITNGHMCHSHYSESYCDIFHSCHYFCKLPTQMRKNTVAVPS